MQEESDSTETAIEWFLQSLSRRGASSYTLRSYRLGLGDFSRWLQAQGGQDVDRVGRREVEDYIAQFASSAPSNVRPARRSAVTDFSDGKPKTQPRSPRTVNHRLSVLSSLFDELIRRDNEVGGPWAGRANPVPKPDDPARHGMPGRDRPSRGRRAELRRREPRPLPRDVDPALAEQLVASAGTARDRAILLLLVRTGQRIGDWSGEHGRHGVLGMRLADLDRRRSSIVVVLKGSRDEHRVPVTEDFWPVWDRYLAERGEPPTEAAWVGRRRGRGKPLSYDAFDASLRALTERIGIERISAHQLRHTLAQQLVTRGGLKAAQEVLGHRHITTTADTYAYADQEEVVRTLADVAARCQANNTPPSTAAPPERFVFMYDEITITELDAVASPRALGRDER